MESLSFLNLTRIFATVPFKLTSKYSPTGDQPEAIRQLVRGVKETKELRYYWVSPVAAKLLL